MHAVERKKPYEVETGERGERVLEVKSDRRAGHAAADRKSVRLDGSLLLRMRNVSDPVLEQGSRGTFRKTEALIETTQTERCKKQAGHLCYEATHELLVVLLQSERMKDQPVPWALKPRKGEQGAMGGEKH